ncbi:MAG: D-alanyl-D-alanine carboxypeptidase/D-alanyl-D-alanine-endopeptidase, partial [Pedosphaera parvula]|nr:D-alanyl-D-alanine carboxypeptidase/D-alanyl-D-alanine-endopeptidase [Pedosphaera parvula]
MKRILPAPTAPGLVVAISLLIVMGKGSAQVAPVKSGARSPAELREQLAALLDQPRFAAAAWGVKIVSLDTGATLFERNAGKLFKPASNAKLFTGALALDRLGPDFRISTALYATARPDARGVVKGDLIVYGRGDPSFAARFNGGDYTRSLAPLVDALVNAGMKRITGDLVGDESCFRGPPFGSGWAWDDLQYYYGAGASALTAEDNVVDLVLEPGACVGDSCRIITKPETAFLTFINRAGTTAAGSSRKIDLYRPIGERLVYVTGHLPLNSSNYTDAVAVPDPARWFVTLLKDALARRGIKVEGRVRAANWIDRELAPVDRGQWVEVAVVR